MVFGGVFRIIRQDSDLLLDNRSVCGIYCNVMELLQIGRTLSVGEKECTSMELSFPPGSLYTQVASGCLAGPEK